MGTNSGFYSSGILNNKSRKIYRRKSLRTGIERQTAHIRPILKNIIRKKRPHPALSVAEQHCKPLLYKTLMLL